MDATSSPADSNEPAEPSHTDRVLIALVRNGDATAFEQLYLVYFGLLWKFAYSYVKSPELAEEVVQEVFLSVWVGRSQWTVQSTLRGYLYGAVRNRALKAVAHDSVVQRFTADVDPLEFMSSPTVQPDTQAEMSELERCIAETIRLLPERQRSAMMFRIVNEMTYGEIAEMLNVSIAAIGKLVEKAQKKIRKFCIEG